MGHDGSESAKELVPGTRQPIRSLEEFKKIKGFDGRKMETLLKLLSVGISKTDIAKHMGVARQTVMDWFKWCPALADAYGEAIADIGASATAKAIEKDPVTVLRALFPETYTTNETTQAISNTYIQTESATLIQSLANGQLPEENGDAPKAIPQDE